MLGSIRELERYRDEPRQLPSGSFGKKPHLRLDFERRPDRTVLTTLHRRAPLLVQQALYWDEEMPGLPCVSIISNAGGILQGDRATIDITVAEDAQAHITTQAATRIHEMDANFASQDQVLTLRAGAYLEYIPHPVIPHRNSRFVQHTKVSIDPTATLIYSDVVMPGRKYYGDGEIFEYDLYSSTLRAERPDGMSLFTERFTIEPKRHGISRLGVMGSFHVFGSAVLLTPQEKADRVFEAVAPQYDMEAGIASGVSRLPRQAGLIFKVLGMETAPVIARLRQFWALARHEAVGSSLPQTFLWA